MMSEWRQVYSDPQNSSKYSGWFRQYCILDCLDSSSNLQFPQSLFKSRPEGTNCYWSHPHFQVSQLFQLWGKIQISVDIFAWEFFTPSLADRLSEEFEWQQVSRALLGILADLSNAIVWMVSTRPLISKSSSPFISPLVINQMRRLLLVSPSLSYSSGFFFVL